jgi:hypothetical protein
LAALPAAFSRGTLMLPRVSQKISKSLFNKTML